MLSATYSICKWKSVSDTQVTTGFIFYDPQLSNTEISNFETIFVAGVATKVSQTFSYILGYSVAALCSYVYDER